MSDFYALPWQIQLTLASGYIAYTIGYVGIRHHHKATDVTFLTLAFGLISTVCLAALSRENPVVAGTIAFVSACAGAALWRKFGRVLVWKSLHRFNISWSNDDPSAIATLSHDTIHRMSQFAVELTDGTWLYCDDPGQFANAPFPAVTMGPNGDLALYVTHKEPVGGERAPVLGVRDSHHGDKITYVPASGIRQFVIRHAPKVSSSRAAGAVHSRYSETGQS